MHFFTKNKIFIWLAVAVTMLAGHFASGDVAGDLWYQQLNKSNLTPPGYVFGIVWPILYILMAVAASRTAPIRNLFYIQLIFNALWSWLFFVWTLPALAGLDIVIMLGLNLMIIYKLRGDKTSIGIYLPYILWLGFALYLNLYIVVYN